MSDLLEAMYRALHADIGVEVTVTDQSRLKARFYALRNEHEDLLPLTLQQAPLNPKCFFILRKDVYDAARGHREENTEPATRGLGLPDLGI